MSRIKITGYIDPADLPPGWRNDADRTGLTEEGHMAVTSAMTGPDGEGWLVGSLDDVTVEVER